jgi:hypothetical protein
MVLTLRSTGERLTVSRHAILVGLLAAIAVSPNLLVALSTYDGGLSSSAGTFLLHGALPYRDFWWLYGPASPVLAAVATAVTGPSILFLRLLGIVALGVQAAVGYALIRSTAPHVVAAVVSIGATAATTFILGVELTAWTLAVTLALAGLLARQQGHDRLSGVLIGLAFLGRLDIGVYALAAAIVLPRRRQVILAFGVVAVPFAAIALLTTTLPDLIQQLIWFPLIGTRQFRYVPAPKVEDALSLLLFTTLVLIPKLAVLASAAGCLIRRPRVLSIVPMIVFAALCQLQTVSRGDIYHQADAAFPGLILLGMVAGPSAIRSRTRLPRAVAYLRLSQFAALATTVMLCLIFGSFSILRMETGSLPPGEQALVAGVRTIVANTTRDEPIFVGLTANRITLLNPMLVYYLADRRAAVWATMFNPGVTNTDATQARMVEELKARPASLIYLDDAWAESLEETNDSAIPGSTILDTYLASAYVAVCDFAEVRIVATPERAGSITCAPVRDERMLDILAGIGR